MATVICSDKMDTEPQKLLRWAKDDREFLRNMVSKNKDMLSTTTSSSSSSSSAFAPPPTTEGGADHGNNLCKSINFRRQRFLKSFSFTMPEEEKKSGIVASSWRMIKRLRRSLGCSSSGCVKVYDSHRSSSRLKFSYPSSVGFDRI